MAQGDGRTLSRIIWTVVAPFCLFLAVAAVVVMVRESGGGDAAAADAKTDTVLMEGLTFDPGTITVARGTEITFDNNDVAPHTVTADEGDTNSGIIDPGKAFKLVANESFSYHCEIHPSMKAAVELEG